MLLGDRCFFLPPCLCCSLCLKFSSLLLLQESVQIFNSLPLKTFHDSPSSIRCFFRYVPFLPCWYVHHKMNCIKLHICFYVYSTLVFCTRVKRVGSGIEVPRFEFLPGGSEQTKQEITLNGVLEDKQKFSRWKREISSE